MLLFKKKFIDSILKGEKTQTIRLWRFRRFRVGQRSYIPGVGYISIDAVEQVELDALTDQDAIPDGFPTADSLRAEIHTLYPKEIEAGYKAYKIVFTKLPEIEQKRLKEERANKKKAKQSDKSVDQRKKFEETMDRIRKMVK